MISWIGAAPSPTPHLVSCLFDALSYGIVSSFSLCITSLAISFQACSDVCFSETTFAFLTTLALTFSAPFPRSPLTGSHFLFFPFIVTSSFSLHSLPFQIVSLPAISSFSVSFFSHVTLKRKMHKSLFLPFSYEINSLMKQSYSLCCLTIAAAGSPFLSPQKMWRGPIPSR